MSAAMTEITAVPPALPVSEDIRLKPNKQFRRELHIWWGPSRTSVNVLSKNHETIASARVDNKQIVLWACRIVSPDNSQKVVYSLDTGEATFYVTQREFETLRAKLEPRGVRVRLPEEPRT